MDDSIWVVEWHEPKADVWNTDLAFDNEDEARGCAKYFRVPAAERRVREYLPADTVREVLEQAREWVPWKEDKLLDTIDKVLG